MLVVVKAGSGRGVRVGGRIVAWLVVVVVMCFELRLVLVLSVDGRGWWA